MAHRSSWIATVLLFAAVACDRSEKAEPAPDANQPGALGEHHGEGPEAHADPSQAPVAPPSAVPDAQLGAAPAGEPGASAPANLRAGSEEAPVAAREAPAAAGPRPHPGHCGPAQPCPEGQGCSGLFHDASGECIPLADAKARCTEQDGEWGTWGAMQRQYCMRVLADAGKPCRDGSECEEACIQEKKGEGGKCQKYEIQHGCYSRMTDGKPGTMLCVD